MVEMKYVVVSSEMGEQLIVFPKNIEHKEMADVLSYIKHGSQHNWKRIFREPVAAGFTNGLTCWGRSESLNIASRECDTKLLVSGGSLKI